MLRHPPRPWLKAQETKTKDREGDGEKKGNFKTSCSHMFRIQNYVHLTLPVYDTTKFWNPAITDFLLYILARHCSNNITTLLLCYNFNLTQRIATLCNHVEI